MPWGEIAIAGSVFSGVVLATLFAASWQRRDQPGTFWFLQILLGGAVWTFSYAVALTVFDPGIREWLEVLIWAAKFVIGVAWVAFGLEYAGREDLVTRDLLAAVGSVFAVTLVLIVTNDVHHLMWSNYRIVGDSVATVAYNYGPFFPWVMGYSYAVIGIGILLLLAAAGDSPHFGSQAAALSIGAVVPTLANVLWLLGVAPIPGLDLTPMAFGVTGITFGYALFRAELLVVRPATRRAGIRSVLDDFADPIVVLDGAGRIVELNQATVDLLGRDAESVVGTPLADLVDAPIEIEPGRQTAILSDVGGHRRDFEVVVSTVTDTLGRSVGHTVLFYDVTASRRQTERLEVLGRVLRHNLRNEMNVIQGQIQAVMEQCEGAREQLEIAQKHAEALVRLSERARDTERIVGRAGRNVERIDVESLLAGVRARIEDTHPGVEVEVDAESVHLLTDRTVLTAVVSCAGMAAAATEPGVVSVTATADAEEVTITVSGSGLSLPDEEWNAIMSGKETPLVHASDLDLWVVRWGVVELGGEIERADGGVRLTIPHRSADE